MSVAKIHIFLVNILNYLGKKSSFVSADAYAAQLV